MCGQSLLTSSVYWILPLVGSRSPFVSPPIDRNGNRIELINLRAVYCAGFLTYGYHICFYVMFSLILVVLLANALHNWVPSIAMLVD